MATYYVDASGVSPGGYTNFTTLLAGETLIDGDIIEVVNNGGTIIDNTTVTIDVSVTIKSADSNSSKPLHYRSESGILFQLGNAGDVKTITIKDIAFNADVGGKSAYYKMIRGHFSSSIMD